MVRTACRLMQVPVQAGHTIPPWHKLPYSPLPNHFHERRAVNVFRLGVWLSLGLSFISLNGCSMMRGRTPLPDAVNVEHEQLILHSDFRLPRQHRLVDELVELRHEIARELSLPTSDEPIHVYLFETARDYHGYIKQNHPELPERRAYFVETDTRLTVYTHWGDRVAEDLRHELAHGYLHSVTKHLPLWLDEGLAEYFEIANLDDRMHLAHVQLLAQAIVEDGWEPDLKRLESLTMLDEFTQIDSAEAWLWCHFLLKSTGDRRLLLHSHMALLQDQEQTAALSQTLLRSEPQTEEAVLEHLNILHREMVQLARSANPDSASLR